MTQADPCNADTRPSPPHRAEAYVPLASRNTGWGFYGTIERAGESPETAWRIASALIALATLAEDQNGYGAEGVRDFLDSRDGRHFADMVAGFIATAPGGHTVLDRVILKAIETHQGWKTDRTMMRSCGIPAGLPYLSGMVQYYAGLAAHEGEE